MTTYPHNEESNVMNQMKENLLDSNKIKIKMVQNNIFAVDNVTHYLGNITPLFMDINDVVVFNTSTGDTLIKMKIKQDYSTLFNLYNIINDIFYLFFISNADKLENILTIDEQRFLQSKKNMNLFYSLETYDKGVIYIRI